MLHKQRKEAFRTHCQNAKQTKRTVTKMELDLTYTLDVLKEILAIDSPTGFTRRAAEYACAQFKALGIDAHLTTKGGVFADLGGEDDENAILLSAHIDTLGAMVAEIKANGHLRVRNIGGLTPVNTETEHCKVYTRDGRTYEGDRKSVV